MKNLPRTRRVTEKWQFNVALHGINCIIKNVYIHYEEVRP